MKNNVGIKIFAFLALMASTALTAVAQNQPGKPWQVSVMSYNVQHCAGIKSDVNYDRTADVIWRQQPDVVALQELDSVTTRSEGLNQIEELAKRTLYYPIYASAIDYAGGYRHGERGFLFERRSIGRERFAWKAHECQRPADCDGGKREFEVVWPVLEVYLARRGGHVGDPLHALAGNLGLLAGSD